jgi:PTS system nitrogen regulatory IIA component
MTLAHLLPLPHVFGVLPAADKGVVLHEMCRRASALIGADPRAIAPLLAARETLGSTGIGGGVALPHARLPEHPTAKGFFARLERPIDFAAIDGGRIDLVFLLLSPAADTTAHLAALAQIARRLRDPSVCQALRRTVEPAALHRILIGAGP